MNLSQAELDFLGSHVKIADSVWEWGTGETTKYLASRCRRLVSVEHSPMWAVSAISSGQGSSSVLYVPQDQPLIEHTHDGDGDTHRNYVDIYTGYGVDVVLIDGRARVACARRVAETAPFGPNPGMVVFLHDCERSEYARIWKDRESEDGPDGYFKRIAVVERLMLMEARQ